MPLVGDGGTFYRLKIFVYVSADAAATTTVSVVSPADARLRYLSGPESGKARSDQTELDAATRSVSFDACPAKALNGYIGGLIVSGPSCITLDVTSDRGSEQIRFPTSRSECSPAPG